MPSHRRTTLRLNSTAVETVKNSPLAVYFTGLLVGYPWGQLASMLTALWSAIIIGEWCWKKVKAWRAARRASAE